jgi:L-lactate dehydrogenase complex protein LldF
VKINIPQHLINMRRDIVRNELNGWFERKFYRLWAWALKSRGLYGLIGNLQKWDLRSRAKGTGWVSKMPKVAAGWTQIRDLPAPAAKTFHQMWKKREGSSNGESSHR